ncbi:hypothetical protein NUSPORA_01174 [Nucleospora cyclopteri]
MLSFIPSLMQYKFLIMILQFKASDSSISEIIKYKEVVFKPRELLSVAVTNDYKSSKNVLKVSNNFFIPIKRHCFHKTHVSPLSNNLLVYISNSNFFENLDAETSVIRYQIPYTMYYKCMPDEESVKDMQICIYGFKVFKKIEDRNFSYENVQSVSNQIQTEQTNLSTAYNMFNDTLKKIFWEKLNPNMTAPDIIIIPDSKKQDTIYGILKTIIINFDKEVGIDIKKLLNSKINSDIITLNKDRFSRYFIIFDTKQLEINTTEYLPASGTRSHMIRYVKTSRTEYYLVVLQKNCICTVENVLKLIKITTNDIDQVILTTSIPFNSNEEKQSVTELFDSWSDLTDEIDSQILPADLDISLDPDFLQDSEIEQPSSTTSSTSIEPSTSSISPASTSSISPTSTTSITSSTSTTSPTSTTALTSTTSIKGDSGDDDMSLGFSTQKILLYLFGAIALICLLIALYVAVTKRHNNKEELIEE